MKVTDRMYESVRHIWDKNYEHPFIRGIMDGSLPIENFQFYMIQDHKYLMQYAKVFALGLVKATEESDMRLFSNLITATLDTENAVHQSYLKRLGISRERIEETPSSIVTDSYTNYMISVSEKGGLAELMTAVLACSWSYELIGEYIEQHAPEAKNHEFYGPWVQMYTSEGYRSSNDLMIDMVNRYTEGCTEKQLQYLEHILNACSQYEYMFWDMAWEQKLIEVG